MGARSGAELAGAAKSLALSSSLSPLLLATSYCFPLPPRLLGRLFPPRVAPTPPSLAQAPPRPWAAGPSLAPPWSPTRPNPFRPWPRLSPRALSRQGPGPRPRLCLPQSPPRPQPRPSPGAARVLGSAQTPAQARPLSPGSPTPVRGLEAGTGAWPSPHKLRRVHRCPAQSCFSPRVRC